MNTEDLCLTTPTAQPVLLVLYGPAGCGKTTLCERLVREDSKFKRVITATTRPMRQGEENGKDYHFLTTEEFQAGVNRGDFIEHAVVHRNHYGTLKKSVIEPLLHGQDLVTNIDIQGVRSLQKEAENNAILHTALHSIFIKITPKEVGDRLRQRGTESHQKIAERILTAMSELTQPDISDYCFHSIDKEEDFAVLREMIYDIRIHIKSSTRRKQI